MASKVDRLLPLGPKSSDTALLNLFLTLDKTERRKHFACTLRASEIVGVSRRTIQLWIEMGQIQAVRVSKKYQVHLPSLEEYLNESMAAC
jgi:excisionase family DNA binding protein